MRKDGVESGAKTRPEMGQHGRVIADYRSAYPRPWVMRAGEQLSIGERQSEWDGWIWCANQRGQARWVPERYVQRKGDSCVALCDYQTAELSVSVGEELLIDSEESGWIWCTNKEGRSGWVPATNVQILPEQRRFEKPGESKCAFCHMSKDRIVRANRLAFAVRDQYPVSPLHTLIIPRRHVPSYFDLDSSEVNACHQLLIEMRAEIISSDSDVKGFNIGVNQGWIAGQTISHCHIHLIPRREGDVDEPRGGIRHIIPGKGFYEKDA